MEELNAPNPRRAIVTGGSRGIGRAIALRLAADGCDVIAVSRSHSGLAETASLSDGAIRTLSCDFDDLDAVETVVPRAVELWGDGPAVVVNCAGIVRSGTLASITRADFETSMRVNVYSALIIVQGAEPYMRAAGWGRIINIGSLYSRVGPKYAGPYAVSKHALLGLTRIMSGELARFGITANAVLPGWTDTDMLRDEASSVAQARGIDDEAATQLFLRNQPLGRVIEPDEVAELVAFLASPVAGAITGQGLNIDGGELTS